MRAPWTSSTVALICGLTACDTLYGLRIDLSGVESSTFAKSCFEDAMRKAGLNAQYGGAYRLRVGVPGGDEHLFSVLFERPGPRAPWGASLYRLAGHQPMSCELLQQVVPKMRAAADQVRLSCSTPTRRVDAVEVWSQPRCGL